MNAFLQWLADVLQRFRPWIVIAPWDRGVRIRVGKHATLLGPGPHFRLPLIDEIRVVNTRLRLAQMPCQTVTTRDGKAVTLAGVVGFHVSDPLAAMLALAQPEVACSSYAQTLIARAVHERTLAEISVGDVEKAAVHGLAGFAPGLTFDFVRLVDFAVCRTYRLLQEQWRPQMDHQAL